MELTFHHALICRVLRCLETRDFTSLRYQDYLDLKDAVESVKDSIVDERIKRRDIDKDEELTFKGRRRLKKVLTMANGEPKPIELARQYILKHPNASIKKIQDHLINQGVKLSTARTSARRCREELYSKTESDT